jgi:hypothetical protein
VITEQEIAELQSMIKAFQDLLKSNKTRYYISCCLCGCGGSLNDKFDKKRKVLLRQAEKHFASEEDRWLYKEYDDELV